MRGIIEVMQGGANPDGVHLAVFTAVERPDVWQDAEETFPVVLPNPHLCVF